MQPRPEHHFLQVSVAKWIPEIPPDAEQNDLSLEVTPFERGGGMHEISSSIFSSKYTSPWHIMLVIVSMMCIQYFFFCRDNLIPQLEEFTGVSADIIWGRMA
jgi:hypothetical protein